ncbi:BMP family ABC transporter substrate-binding protein [soil metagenome]
MKPTLLIPAIFASFLLFGCGTKDASTSSTGGGPGPSSLKVGIVFDSGGRGDKSFNDSAWMGVEKAQKELGIEVKTIDSKTAKDYEGNLAGMADAGMDVIVAVGVSQGDALKVVAAKYPTIKFGLVDGSLDLQNVRGLTFKEEQGSYLAGYLAALVSKTKKIGFVGGMNMPLIKKFEVGYSAGAKAADPKVQFLPAKYTESWDDVSLGKAAALVLFNGGADIVYHAAGRCGIGVIDAAAETNHFAIGVDGDQDGVKPGNVLTSMVKHVDVGVFDLIKDVKDGKFTPGAKVYDLKSGGVGLTDFQFTKDVIGEANIKKVEDVKAKIISGEILVPNH